MVSIALFFPAIGINMNVCNDTENANDFECTRKDESSLTAYYSIFSVLWGIGWASSKISYLAILPGIAPSDNSRMALNSFGNIGKITGVIILYGCSWLFVHTGEKNP